MQPTAPGGRRPLDQADRLGPPAAAAAAGLHSPTQLLLLSPKADTHFTIPRKVEGWVDLGGWLDTQMTYPPEDGHPSKY